MIVPDPPVLQQMEVENTKAATNTATDVNDVVMAEYNVEREANVVHEVTVNAEAPVPPRRPHTIEQAYDHG